MGILRPPGAIELSFEVSFSESFTKLRDDARWWYANTNRTTKIIVLIHTSRTGHVPEQAVDFEIWTEVPNELGPATRNRPETIIVCTQSARVQNTQVVSGGPLVGGLETVLWRGRRTPFE